MRDDGFGTLFLEDDRPTSAEERVHTKKNRRGGQRNGREELLGTGHLLAKKKNAYTSIVVQMTNAKVGGYHTAPTGGPKDKDGVTATTRDSRLPPSSREEMNSRKREVCFTFISV